MKMLKLYHGTNADLKDQSLKLADNTAHKNGSSQGFGLYTTPDKDFAAKYGRFIIELHYRLANPLSPDKITLTKNEQIDLLISVEKATGFFDNYLDPNGLTAEEMIPIVYPYIANDYNLSDIDIVNDIANSCGELKPVTDWLIKHGYNYTKSHDGRTPVYVLYDQAQFKD